MTDLKITEATVQLVVNEQEPVFLQVLRGPIVVAGGGGVTVHNDLTGRSDPDAHPISSITGLSAALAAAGNVDSVNGQTGTVVLDLDDLTDVDTTTDPPDADDVLAWDGVMWTPATLTALGAPGLSNATPADLGTAAAGVSTEASRADHVHDMPTAAQVGALPDNTALLALGETSTTAYRGDRGKTAYDHSQITTGNPHGTSKADVGLGNVDNTSDANKPVSTAQQTALDGKAAASHSHSGADITSGTVATARLGSGTANATTFLRGDQTWAAAGGGGGVTEVRMTTTSFHSSDGPANNPRPVGITTSQSRGRSILSPFTATGTTQVFGGVPWLPWSTVDIWIDFLNTNASAGDVKWQVAFGGQAGAHTQLTLYAATVAVTAASGNETTYGQRYTQKIASAVAVATTDMLDCQVVRLGDDAADTLAGSVWLKQLRFREAGT